VCITWTNVDGKVLVLLDGVLKKAALGYKVDVTIPSGGIMRIGQQQRELGGDHNPVQSYRGKFAKINMWNTVLDGSVIVALWSSPGAESGDVISWGNMRTALISGNVMVQDVANMQLTGDTRTIPYYTKGMLKLSIFRKLISHRECDLSTSCCGPLSVTQYHILERKGLFLPRERRCVIERGQELDYHIDSISTAI